MNPSRGALPPSATPDSAPVADLSAQKVSPATAPEPSAPPAEPMAGADSGTAADQISGIYTMAIMDSLEERLSADDLCDFMARAGETRSVEDLKDLASWT